MKTRLDGLDDIFKSIVQNVYFQPPQSIKLKYPCVVYELANLAIAHADNYPYKHQVSYKVTVIDKDPDSILPSKIAELQSCRFDRFYTSDNLNHWAFSLYV